MCNYFFGQLNSKIQSQKSTKFRRLNLLKEYTVMAQQLYDDYYQNWGWHYILVGLHKLLTHVPQLQLLLDYPFSFTSEEAIESGHHLLRLDSMKHGVKASPKTVNQSIMRHRLIYSCPDLAEYYTFSSKTKSHREIYQGVKRLLVFPTSINR